MIDTFYAACLTVITKGFNPGTFISINAVLTES